MFLWGLELENSIAFYGFLFHVSGFTTRRSRIVFSPSIIHNNTFDVNNRGMFVGSWELVFVTCYFVFSLYTLNRNISREVGTGHIGNKGYRFDSVMDILGRELQQILRHREEISEANRFTLRKLSIQVRDLE
jgi:hypothetical protein